MANIFEFLSKDGKITPEKVRKLRQMQFRDKMLYVGIFAIDEPRSPDCALYATLVSSIRL